MIPVSLPVAVDERLWLPNGRLLRIGVLVGPTDPFWVQVGQFLAERLGSSQVVVGNNDPEEFVSETGQASLLEELLSEELDAFICTTLPSAALRQMLDSGLPVISLDERVLEHPAYTSLKVLANAAQIAGGFLADRLQGQGRVLCIAGDVGYTDHDSNVNRIRGLCQALAPYPGIGVSHVRSSWLYERARPDLEAQFRHLPEVPDAIFGLSDTIALAARDVGRELGVVDGHTLIVGVNGDPLALAAIAEGSLSATVSTPARQFAWRAIEVACLAARKQPVPPHYSFTPLLVTSENVAQVSLQKLIEIAGIPSRLVGVNRAAEQNRLKQLEISAAISRRVGIVLDPSQLVQAFASLIQSHYGYDQVQLWLWSEAEQRLSLAHSEPPAQIQASLPLAAAGLLGQALHGNESIFIPDVRYCRRYPPDPHRPETQARVVLPIRFGGRILGLLDLHNDHPRQHIRNDVLGLQALADYLGIALYNSELYAEALKARATAEKADLLKTRLLANVSHELREPLNVILGYTKAALAERNPYQMEFPAELRQDLERIYCSGEHLIHLINDLLDLSRAEIGELDLFPETIATRAFLEQVFRSLADSCADAPNVTWDLRLPERLPMIQADPVRLRQILFNLLNNARRFTATGHITLGAEVAPPHLHLWVQDTGLGIPVEQQELIFQPFVSIERFDRRPQGIGLGLTIVRRLVALHGCTLSLVSSPAMGSTFNIYLPLPSLSGQPPAPGVSACRSEMLLLSTGTRPPQELVELSERGGWTIRHLHPQDHLETILREASPVLLAWDITDSSRDEWPLVQQLHTHPRTSRLPLVVYSRESAGAPVCPAGLIDVITKPVSGATLMETLNALVPAKTVKPVWIVDDDAGARELYVRLAAEALPGHPIRQFEDGAAVLEQMGYEIPDLVILDLVMPGVDGFAVVEHLRTDPRTRSVPVLVMSGKALSLDDIRRLDYARVMFQSKQTLEPSEAVTCLQQLFGGAADLPQPTSALVKRALVYIHQNYNRPLSRHEIAEAVGVTVSYLSRIFRHEVGLSPWECLTRLRIRRAKELLSRTGLSITEVASQVGFDDPAYFSRVFRKAVGQSSKVYRRQTQRAAPSL